jgi:thiosulfate/3-mercaptopyruvate sulfurtransferase
MMNPSRFPAAIALAAALAVSGDKLQAQPVAPRTTELSAGDVAKVINNEDWILVDTRATDAYNGWKLDGVKRGGHLPGAVDFPASWLDSDREDKAEMLSMALGAKGIERHRHIVLYGTNRQDRDRVAACLRTAGYHQLYDFDLHAWVDDASRPLLRYKNFHLLVPASIVKCLLDGQIPETFERAKRVKFVEVSWGGEAASYAQGHIPLSFHVNTDHFEPPPAWKLGEPAVLVRFAEQYGFQADDTAIVFGADPTASYRLAIVLRYMGVEDVRVLNGGFAAWKTAQYPIETKRHPPPSAAPFGARIPGRPHLIDEISRVKVRLRAPADFTLVDTRTWAEFTGQTSGYKYHFRKGRIPGSVYGQADFRGADSLMPYRNLDNTMRNANEIQALWQESGVDTRKHLSFMCGGGWRAAEVLTFAQVMGLSNTSLYSDGWIGWSSDPRNPVETGTATAGTDRARAARSAGPPGVPEE